MKLKEILNYGYWIYEDSNHKSYFVSKVKPYRVKSDNKFVSYSDLIRMAAIYFFKTKESKLMVTKGWQSKDKKTLTIYIPDDNGDYLLQKHNCFVIYRRS